MTKRCAHINLSTGKVENLIVADPEVDDPWPGYLLVVEFPDFVQIGTEWDGKDFVRPAPPTVTPDSVKAAAPKMRFA